MTATEVLNYLQREIHTTVAATTDTDGLPVTCAIDMMAVSYTHLDVYKRQVPDTWSVLALTEPPPNTTSLPVFPPHSAR